ncbi:MAG: hypothetical protein EAX96_05075 [Candidatus Lokiarchaeota archaeon]|nr:hypothetical protein [Candidatus Lokiarchaeota archaeon]
MSISPQTILAKILRSSRAIKEVLICDKVGLIISKVLRITPIEGLGAMESSCFKAAEEITEFLNLGKEVIHISIFPKLAIIGMEIGLGYLIIVLDHRTQFLLDSEIISSALNELVNMWINELGLQGYDFSVVNGVNKALIQISKGKYSPIKIYQEALDDFDMISVILDQVKNPLIKAQCITNELGLSVAFQKQSQIKVEADEFGGGLLSLDAIVKEKGESTGLGSPVMSIVFTDTEQGVMTAHAGTMENDPIIYESLFSLKDGFVPILSETGSIISTLSNEYKDAQTNTFIETIEDIAKQIAPDVEPSVRPGEVKIEAKPAPVEAAAAVDAEPVKNLLSEMGKNIEESVTYYMNQLSELMELVASRSKELKESLDSYDQDLQSWVNTNIDTFKQFGLDKEAKTEIEKWNQAMEIIISKLEKLEEK